MRLTFNQSWIDPISLGEEGIVVGRTDSLGIGTLLVLKCLTTKRVLMGRKSFREGFEGSNQFTFPGGMLRSDGSFNFQSCLELTLRNRVLEETGVSLQSIVNLVPMDEWPPIIARYTVRGSKMVSAAILPFYGECPTELPTTAYDNTVHSVGWYDPFEILHEITQTNALILAQALWTDCSIVQREDLKLYLATHFEDVKGNAELVGAILPKPAWEE